MIVVCGEAMVDLLPDESGASLTYRPVLGGSAFNVARGVARLNGQAAYLWELSTDRLGEALAAALAQDGVVTAAVTRAPRATPVAVVDFTGGEPRYNIADPDKVMVETVPPPLPAGTTCLVVGSAVLAQEPVAAHLEGLAATAPLAAIDFNVRPPSIVDLAGYRARLGRIVAGAAIVKASDVDLTAIGEDDPIAYMRAAVAGGTALAILTRGADGAEALTPSAHVSLSALPCPVVDPVGAGDAFMAGLLAALQRAQALSRPALAALSEADLRKIVTFAQQAAAACCGARGAVMPHAEELESAAYSVA